MITHRPRLPDDVEACVVLLRRIRQVDGYPRFWPKDARRFVDSPAEVGSWVAELDGEVVGHVALHDAAPDPILPVAGVATGQPAEALTVVARLFTSPDARGQGLGRGLLELATAEAHARGQQPVLDVDKALGAAVRLYEAAGWTLAGDITLSVQGSPLACWVYLGPPPPGPVVSGAV